MQGFEQFCDLASLTGSRLEVIWDGVGRPGNSFGTDIDLDFEPRPGDLLGSLRHITTSLSFAQFSHLQNREMRNSGLVAMEIRERACHMPLLVPGK